MKVLLGNLYRIVSLAIIVVFVVHSGNTIAGMPKGTSDIVFMTQKEAEAVVQRAAKAYKNSPANAREDDAVIWNQPVNKKEACLLPLGKKMLAYKNFKQFWDGDCKDGYAYGLGRDIVVSDQHNIDEIIRHDHRKVTEYGSYILAEYNDSKITIYGQRLKSYKDELTCGLMHSVNTAASNIFYYRQDSFNVHMVTKIKYDNSFPYVTQAIQNGIPCWDLAFPDSPDDPNNKISRLSFINENANLSEGIPLRSMCRDGTTGNFIRKNGSMRPLVFIASLYWRKLDSAIDNAREKTAQVITYWPDITKLHHDYLQKLNAADNKIPEGLTAERYYAIREKLERFNVFNQTVQEYKHYLGR